MALLNHDKRYWVLFPEDILNAPEHLFDSKPELICLLQLHELKNGGIYWVSEHGTLYTRDLTRKTNKQWLMSFTHTNRPFCNFLFRSLGRPLRVYYAELIRLACFRLNAGAAPHHLWDCNLAILIFGFIQPEN